MKNKKGFTLVELLAVIAILAILVIIALPNVLKMFRSAKENTFVTEVQEIVKTAEQNYLSGSLSNKECKCFSSASNPLNLNGRNNIEYYVEFNDKGQVINLIVKDDNYQFVSEREVINIADIGSSTSEKARKTSLALESTEVPSCDGGSEDDNQTDIKYSSMLTLANQYEIAESLYYFLTQYNGEYNDSREEIHPPLVTSTIESLKTVNTNKVPEGVISSADVSNDRSENIMMWWTDIDGDNLYEITIGGEGGVRANTNSSDLFKGMENLTSIDLTYLDTSEVTDMGYMFYRCSSLTSITYGNKFVINEDTNIYGMFSGTDNLTNEPYIKFNSIYAERLNGN